MSILYELVRPWHELYTDVLRLKIETLLAPKSAYGITAQRQKTEYDCGQTCLDMLGYDGHGMFPTRLLTTKQLMSIEGVVLREDIDNPHKTFYDEPCMIVTTNFIIGHWTIGYKDRIFCPSRGILTPKQFFRNRLYYHPDVYQVPFKSSK